jgi:branched-subunit amino acid ABC-type transport system permease component
MTYQVGLNIAINASLIWLVALSFWIPYRVSGFFNISHALVLSFGGFLGYSLLENVGLNIWLCLLIVLFICMLLALSLDRFLFSKAKRLGAEKWQMLVMSLGVYVFGQNMISIFWGNDILLSQVWVDTDTIFPQQWYIINSQVLIFCIAILGSGIVLSILKNTKFGHDLNCCAENQSLAEVFGINLSLVTSLSVALGGGIIGIVGFLLLQDTGISNGVGFQWLLHGVVAMIIGGANKPLYIFLGALILSITQQLVAFYLDSRWMESVTFLILVIFLIIKPMGLGEKRVKKVHI